MTTIGADPIRRRSCDGHLADARPRGADPIRRLYRTAARHPGRFFAGALALALVLAAIESGVAALRARGAPAWIWAAGEYRAGEPIAFHAVRDFELDDVAPARLAILADETYVAYLNGVRVGGNAYRPGAPLDLYDVGPFLKAGWNRLLVELRSSRGAGGLVARLELEQNDNWRPLLETDDAWRIFRRHDDAVFRGTVFLDHGEPPQVWRRAPTGRWRLGPGHVERPIPFYGFPPLDRRAPVRVRQPVAGSGWQPIDPVRKRLPALGPQQLYDWGEVVEGLLVMDLVSATGAPGLLYFATDAPPDPEKRRPDAVLLPVPGRRFWEDAHLRQFRYLLIVGVEPESTVEVDLLDPALLAPLGPPAPEPGVFGLEPPRPYTKVEESIWRRVG